MAAASSWPRSSRRRELSLPPGASGSACAWRISKIVRGSDIEFSIARGLKDHIIFKDSQLRSFRLNAFAQMSTKETKDTAVAQILVVEDEPAIAESVAYSLNRAGHSAEVATSLRAARAILTPQTELVVLDLMLPDGSGFDWIEELEERRRSGLAVIVLSSRDAESDRVRALEMGADDYVTKPFSPREVVARAAAVLRRLHPSKSVEALDAGTDSLLTVDVTKRRVTIGETSVELTRVEFDLLQLFHSEPGRVFARS